MIQTHESWQRNVDPFLSGPGVRTYPLVEIAFGGPIFHVEALVSDKDSNETIWSTYLLADISDLIQVIMNESVKKADINVLIRQFEQGRRQCEMTTVLEISELRDKQGVVKLKYKCGNGKTYYAFSPFSFSAKSARKNQLYLREGI